jgi:adenine-specific DNA-methyltransferase
MINLINGDNLKVKLDKYDLIYADCIYESEDLDWIARCIRHLKDNSVFIIQTDHHTVFTFWCFIEEYFSYVYKLNFLNHLVWKNEWGNHPKDRFHQCFDDILIFTKGDYKFHSDRIQVPKATVNTKLNPSGRETKTATAWIDDICLTTTAKERIKLEDGHLVRWQKPVKLIERLLLPFLDEGDDVLDFYMGTGTVGEVCKKYGFNYTGIENDEKIFNIAKERLDD